MRTPTQFAARALFVAAAVLLVVFAVTQWRRPAEKTVSGIIEQSQTGSDPNTDSAAHGQKAPMMDDRRAVTQPTARFDEETVRKPLGIAQKDGSPLANLADRYAKAKLVAQEEDTQGASLVRTRLIRDESFKYPLIRVVDRLRRAPKTGELELMEQTAMVADHVMVKKKPGVTDEAFRAEIEAAGMKVRSKKKLSEVWLVEIPAVSVSDHPDALDQLQKRDWLLRFAEPDYIVHTNVVPDDASFSQLWGLHNTGQTGGLTDADIDGPEAWNLHTGSHNVVVGVIDTGIQYDHPDLAANMWLNPNEIAGNGVDDDRNGFVDDIRGWDFVSEDNNPYDDNSHGTHCAGTIGGVGNNGTGVAGVCWQVRMMGLKFLNAGGSGTTSDAVEATAYGTIIGCDLTSNSWGGGGASQALLDEILKANDAGILFVAAAGNNSSNTDVGNYYPQGYASPNVISVSSTDHNDALSGFSNFGLVSCDLGAPGSSVYSTIPGSSYGSKSGTSMATPHVAGACALLKSFRPNLTASEIKALVMDTGDPIPALAGRTVSGKRLNIHNALLSVSDFVVTPGNSITVTGTAGAAFAPQQVAYSVKNFGTTALTWTAVESADWLQLSSSSGSLDAGQSSSLTLTIDQNVAATKAAGVYPTDIIFTASTGSEISVQVVLNVLPQVQSFFTEPFESGTLASYWSSGGTGPFRTQVTSLNSPRSGNFHATMDTRTSNVFARNELTLTLDLSTRDAVRMTFWARGFSEDAHGPPTAPFSGGADFDGVAISADGGATWFEVQSLRSLTGAWQQYVVDLDSAIIQRGLTYTPNFKIRFNQYDNELFPGDGIAIDDIELIELLDKRLVLTLPSTATEGGTPLSGTLTIDPPSPTPLTVTLTSSDAGEIAVPATLLIPEGSTSVPVSLTLPGDTLADGTQKVTITASAPTYQPSTPQVAVHDDENVAISVTLPTSVEENAGDFEGTVSTSAPVAKAVTVSLVSSDPVVVQTPATVTIPAGQSSATFTAELRNDISINGTRTYTVTGSVTNWTTGSDTVDVLDDETSVLSLSLPNSVSEPDGILMAAGRVSIPGVLLTDLVVALQSPDSTELTVPSSVTIPAGQTSVSFAVTVVNDALVDGAQNVDLTASVAGFTPSTVTVTVLDDDGPPASVSNPQPPHLAANVQQDADLSWSASAGEQIQNGDFESGTLTGWGTTVPASSNWAWVHQGTFDPAGSEGPVTPYAGNSCVTLAPNSAGTWTLFQDVFVPTDGAVPTLNWAQRIRNSQANYFDPTQEYRVEVRNPSTGAVLSVLYSTNPGDFQVMDWHLRSGSLLPWRGQTVRLTFVVQHGPSNLAVSLDAISLQTGGAGTVYDVFLGTGAVLGSADLLGSSPTRHWMLPVLSPGTYFWRIDARRGGMTTTGPVWQFSVPEAGVPSRLVWNAVSTPQSNGAPFIATVRALDSNGNPASSFSGAAALSAVPAVPAAPPVVISEMNPNGTNEAEFTNVSGAAVDVGGWQIALYDSVTWPTPAAQFTVPSGTTLAAGAVFRVQESSSPGGSFPSFLLGRTLNWTTGSASRIAVMLRNAQGDVVDFAATSSAQPAMITVPTSLPIAHWTGAVIPDLFLSTQSYQRVGSRDNHNLSDWLAQTSSPLAVNAGLTRPFESSGTAAPVVSPVSVHLTAGAWTGSITAASALINQQFKLRALEPGGASGDSNLISLTQANGTLTMGGQATVAEGAGTISAFGNVTLSPAAPTSGTIRFVLTNGDVRISVPDVAVSEGATSVPYSVTVSDDALMSGNKSVVLTAIFSGYRAANHAFTVTDSDTGTLNLAVSGAPPFAENVGTLPSGLSLTSSVGAGSDVVVQLVSSAPGQLAVPSTVILPAGQTSVNAPLTVIDDAWVDGTQEITVTATIPGLTPASVNVQVTDNEAATLTVNLPANSTEGAGNVTGIVSLAGAAFTDLAVSLSSSDSSELTVPASVTIPAGQSGATFTATVVDDSDADGSQTGVVTASASGFTSGTDSVEVRDNDAHHFSLSAIGDPQVRGLPVPVTITARLVNNTTASTFTGTATLTALDAASGPVPLTPAVTGAFVNGVWSGSVTFSANATGAVLTAVSGGVTGSSNAFNIGFGSLAALNWSAIASPQTVNTPFAATLTAVDTAGNTLGTHTGPATLWRGTPGPAVTFAPNGSTNTLPGAFSNTRVGRTQVIYRASELGGAPRRVSGIALFVQRAPSSVATYTVRMRHTQQQDYLTTGVRVWENAAALTQVYQGALNITTTGWVSLNFPRAFEFNGVDNLLVDFTYQNGAPVAVNGVFAARNQPETRLIYSTSNVVGVDPLTWTGTSPSAITQTTLPALQLLTETLSPAAPDQANPFTAGTWSGNMRMPSVGSSFRLIARDPTSGLEGVSGAFAVNAGTGSLALSFSTTPAQVTENGAGITGTVTVTPAPVADLVVNLNSSHLADLTTPATVTVLAGMNTASFPISAPDDALVEGDEVVNLDAHAPGYTSGIAAVRVLDDESGGTISLNVPTEVREGDAPATGTVTLSATAASPVTVDLVSSDTGEISVPASVTVSAGQNSANFSLTVVNDTEVDGRQNVIITASASGLGAGTGALRVADDDLSHFTFAPVSSPQVPGAQVPASITARTLDGEVLTSFTGTASLTAEGTGGPFNVSPGSTAAFSNGVWSGSVTITGVGTGVALVATSGARSGSSSRFDLQGSAVSQFGFAPILTFQMAGVPFQSQISAQDVAGLTVPTYDGSVELAAVRLGGDNLPAPVLITEVNPNTPDAIEFTNVSSSPVDVSGWTVSIFDWNGGPLTITLPASSICAVGQVFRLEEFGSAPGTMPNFFTGGNINWTAETSAPIGVMLRNASGVIMDFVCAGAVTANSVTQPVPVPPSHWNGAPIALDGANGFSRVGVTDQNTRVDWQLRTSSINALNAGLTVPFGILTSVTPASAGPFSLGGWAGPLSIGIPGSYQLLCADPVSGFGGRSNVFSVLAEATLSVALPASVQEGGAPGTATVSLGAARSVNTTVSLASAAPQHVVPAVSSVLIPAGQTSASFFVLAVDNASVDGPRSVSIHATATACAPGTQSLLVLDDEAGGMTVSLPVGLRENVTPTAQGTLTLAAPATANTVVTLVSSDTTELTVPSTVTVFAGQTTATFSLVTPNDTLVDGVQNVTVTASAVGWGSANATTPVQDDDFFGFTGITTVSENGITLTGTVIVTAPLSTPLTIQLSSSAPARLGVQPSVVLPAGSTSATFSMNITDNALMDGFVDVTIQASAEGFNSSTRTIRVVDNELSHFAISSISSPQVRGGNFSFTVSARDITDQQIPNYIGPVTLTAATLAGVPVTLSTSSATLNNGTSTVSLNVPSAADNVVITASAAGRAGSSNSFNVLAIGPLNNFLVTASPTTAQAGANLNLSVTARDVANVTVTSFTGPVTLTATRTSSDQTTGSGAVSWGYPFNGSADHARVQSIYTPAELGGAKRLTGMALNVLTSSSTTFFNTNIRLKHTTRTAFASNDKAWETSGWTTVFTSSRSYSLTGWQNATFSTPFDYNGQDNLMVDISYSTKSGTTTPQFAATSTATTRSLFAISTSTAPLNWTANNPTSNTSTNLLDLRFTNTLVLPMIPEVSGSFVNGVWSGPVVVQSPGTGVVITARDPVTARLGSTGSLSITSAAALTLSVGSPQTEGAGTYNGTVSLPAALVAAVPVEVTLSSSDSSEASVPGSVTIPVGANGANFPITIGDDTDYDGSQSTVIQARAVNHDPAAAGLLVHDNDGSTLTLSGLPASLVEGGSNPTVTLTLGSAALAPLTVTLTSSDTTEITVPATVTIATGQTTASFTATVVNDTLIDGQQPVTLTASAAPWTSGTASTVVEDNEISRLTLSGSTLSYEGSSSFSWTVALPAAAVAPVTVNLSSSDTSEVTVPPSVTIGVGSTSATFSVSFPQDAISDGLQQSVISAVAEGFAGASDFVSVRDDEVFNYTISTITGPRLTGQTTPVSISAWAVDGTPAFMNLRVLNYSAAGTGGSVPVSPVSNTASGYAFNANLAFSTPRNNVTLTVTDNFGRAGISNPFDVVATGPLARLVWGTVTSPRIRGAPFLTSLTAQDVQGNTVTSFSGAAALSAASDARQGVTGVGSSGSGFYMLTASSENRMQSIYHPAQLGAAGRITSLALNVTILPPVPLTNFTVRLKHTTKTDFSGTGNNTWESSGWITCYQRATTIATTGWTTLHFTQPFDYDGSSNLMVDWSYDNVTAAASGGVVQCTTLTTGSTLRTVYGTSNGTNGDPLLWSGTSPSATTSNLQPNLRLNFEGAALPLSIATTGSFTNGVWTGFLSVLDPGTNVKLIATEAASGVRGESAFFTVQGFGVLTLSLPPSLTEGASGTGTVTLPAPAASNLTVNLISSDSSQISLASSSVVIPSGSSSASFGLTAVDDAAIDGSVTSFIGASAAGYGGHSLGVAALDNDSATLTIHLPGSATEGSGSIGGVASVQINPAPTRNVLLSLASSSPARLTVPATVLILAGQSSAPFALNLPNNQLLDGNQTVTVTASLPGSPDGTENLNVIDDEPRTLVVTLPATLVESDGPTNGSVSISGQAVSPLTINLASSVPGSLTAPTSVNIPSGSSSASFALTPVPNTLPDGARSVTVTATAATFSDGSGTVSVRDDDLHRFAFQTVPATQISGAPFTVQIRALTLDGDPATAFTGAAALTAAHPGGAILVTPSSTGSFTNAEWSGSVTLPGLATDLRLTAAFGDATGQSNPFSLIVGGHVGFVFDTITSPKTRGQPFGVTLRAVDAGGNTVTSYAGNAALSAFNAVPSEADKVTGTGTNLTNQPFNATAQASRSQMIYLPAEVGTSGRLSSLAVEMETLPTVGFTECVVRLQHSSQISFAGPNNLWISTGWTTVFSGPVHISESGWLTLPFSRGFDYNGTSNLIVDISFNNTLTGTGGLARSSSGSSRVLIANTTVAAAGALPVNWAGAAPSPSIISLLPNLRFSRSGRVIALMPATTGAFSGGIWSGNVTINDAGSAVTLGASDLAASGSSNAFAVAPANPVLGAEPPFTGGTSNLLSWSSVPSATHYQIHSAVSPSTLMLGSGWTTGLSHLRTGLAHASTVSYRIQSRFLDSAPFDRFLQDRAVEFASSTASGVNTTQIPGSALLQAGSDAVLAENLDQAGTDWSATLFTDVASGTTAVRDALSTAVPNTTPALPINLSGDLEARLTSTGLNASALMPATPANTHGDVTITAFVHPAAIASGTRYTSLLARASRAVSGTLLNGYALRVNTTSATTFNASINLVRHQGGVESILGTGSTGTYDPLTDNLRAELVLRGTRISARLWRVTVTGGVLTETLIGSPLIVIDSIYSSGVAGIHAGVTAGTANSDFDDISIQAASNHVASGTLTTPAITPSPWSRWRLLTFARTLPAGTTFTVDVLDPSGAPLVSNIASGTDLNNLGAVQSAPSIRLRANFGTSNINLSPELLFWSVGYDAGSVSSVESGLSAAVTSTQDALSPVLSAPALTTTASSAVLAGTAIDDVSGLASLSVNGATPTTSNGFANWTRTFSGLPDGTTSVSITASDNAVPANTTTLTTAIFRIATPGGDSDGNGIGNLLQHALGISSGAANARAQLPSAGEIVDTNTGETHLTLTYRRRIERGGLQYIVETSTDLVGWNDTGADVQELSSTPTGDGVTEQVTVRINPSTSLEDFKFVRLTVRSNG